ncbi:MAG: terpene cyclase/mutase family protein [Pirellulaceae bacterium]|nr:terpene cyclase/mutase family protein [Pirellulaceae bacterium]
MLTLIVGSGAFAVAFFVMQRSSWAADKPVAKCLILSVIAHLILLAYAYSWNLVTKIPLIAATVVVPIRVADQSSSEEEQPPAPEQKPIWEQIPTTEWTPPDTLPAAEPLKTDLVVDRLTESADDHQPAANDQGLTDPIQSEALAEILANAAATQGGSRWLEPLLQPTTPIADSLAKFALENPLEAAALPTPPEAAPPDPVSENPIETSVESQLLQNTMEQIGMDRPVTDQDRIIAEWVDGQDDPKLLDQQTASQDAENSQAEIEKRLQQLEQQANADSAAAPPPVFDPRTTDLPWSDPVRISAQAAQAAQAQRRATQRRAADQQPLPEVYSRRADRQLSEVEVRGGSIETEQAVARGLAFLASIQKPDGSWNPRETGGGREQQILGHNRQGAGAQADTGITALAVLAFMADGSTHLGGPYQDNVRRGLEFLIQRQQRGGSLAGSAQYYAQMYCHSMALLALGEAYALTGDERLRPSVQAGVTYSIETQNRAGGGWRYQPQEAGDMSQFGWQAMALRSANLNGIALDEQSQRLMATFLQRHTRGPNGGLATYRVGEPTSPTMTAEALFSRYLLGQRLSRLQVEEATQEIMGLTPIAEAADGPPRLLTIQDCRNLPGRQIDNLYFWYYGSMALRQAASDPNSADSALVQQSWELWNKNLSTRLLSLQRSTGPESGSWDPEACLWGGYGGRVYTTSLAVLCLQVYYRYDIPLDGSERTAMVPWSPTPIGPAPPQRGPATGSIRDWR